MIVALIWVAAIIAAVVLYLQHVNTSFKRHGVKTLPPLPLIGNMLGTLLRKENTPDAVQILYDAFPEERFVGKYEFMSAQVMIRDIDLIKKITVKDFEYFIDRRTVVDEDADPLFGRNLFSLRGQEWKDMRSTLSPAFTSSKIRLMVPFMVDVGELMNTNLMQKIKDSGVDYIDVECKDLTTRVANDVIASCAFGLKVDSHNDTDNEFYTMGKRAATFKVYQILSIFLYWSFPKLMKYFKLTLLTKATTNFFTKLVLGTMKDRETRNVIRHDMIHLLMEAKKGKLSHENTTQDADVGYATVEESAVGKKDVNRAWTDNDLIAQAVLFFLAGFETVSSTMSFLLHELALNPEVQERLAQEILDSDARTGGKFDNNTIQNLPYLDMVISEVLRLYPPLAALGRMCLKDYNIGKPNSASKEDFIIRRGTNVAIPAWALHHDPQYFPEPYKFDPERFSDENKHNIKPFTYMPFGLGPRNCIGSRFALCEVKIIAYQLLREIEVSPCEKTCIPTKLAKDNVNHALVGGHWLRFRVRK